MNDRNLGHFEIDEKLIREEPEKVAAIFAKLKVVPVRVESLFDNRCVRYTAIAERFKEVPVGSMIPEYWLEIQTDSAGWPVKIIVHDYALESDAGKPHSSA